MSARRPNPPEQLCKKIGLRLYSFYLFQVRWCAWYMNPPERERWPCRARSRPRVVALSRSCFRNQPPPPAFLALCLLRNSLQINTYILGPPRDQRQSSSFRSNPSVALCLSTFCHCFYCPSRSVDDLGSKTATREILSLSDDCGGKIHPIRLDFARLGK